MKKVFCVLEVKVAVVHDVIVKEDVIIIHLDNSEGLCVPKTTTTERIGKGAKVAYKHLDDDNLYLQVIFKDSDDVLKDCEYSLVYENIHSREEFQTILRRVNKGNITIGHQV